MSPPSISLVLMFGLAVLLWLGPSLVGALRAGRARGRERRTYLWTAAIAALPFLAAEGWLLAEASSTYDGFCRHAPDIRYSCSAGRYAFEMLVPSGPFALFAVLILGVPALVFGLVVLRVGRSRVSRSLGSSGA